VKELHKMFKAYEQTLGKGGKLGLSATLIDSSGQRAELSFNSNRLFPMASLVKIPIGMALVSQVENGAIRSSGATPGPARNPLDWLYFCPVEIWKTQTLDRLLSFMLHHSDNTACDAIVRRLGGISAVQEFLSTSGPAGICATRTISELLHYYYDLPRGSSSRSDLLRSFKRARDIFRTVRGIRSPYVCRMEKEKHLAESGEDSCTPAAIARLFAAVVGEAKYSQLLAGMRRCATGKRRIFKALEDDAFMVKSFAHKTGSLGAITNDVGIIEFQSGDVAIMAIMISKSDASLPDREQTIASVATGVLNLWRATGDLQ